MGIPEIRVDLEKKCKRCKKKGATQNGYCLQCLTADVKKGKCDSMLKPIQDIIEGLKGGKHE